MPIKGYLSIRRAAGRRRHIRRGGRNPHPEQRRRAPLHRAARHPAARRACAVRARGAARVPAAKGTERRGAERRTGAGGTAAGGGCRLPGGLPACDGVRGLGGGASAGAGGRRADPRVHGGRPAASLRGWQAWVGARSPMPPRPQRGRGPDSGARQGRTAIFLGLPRRGRQGAGRRRGRPRTA